MSVHVFPTSAGHLSLSHADIQEAIFKRYLKSSVSNLEADYHRILAGQSKRIELN